MNHQEQAPPYNEGESEGRIFFTNGVNIVALADPDAMGDSCCQNMNPDLFDASLSTPAISLNGAVPNTATVSFDSSWLVNDTHTSELQVEFFNADGNSLSLSAEYLFNQTVVVDLLHTPAVVDLQNGDTVWVAPGHTVGGEIDQVYRYVGADTSGTNLNTQDYTTSDWVQDATVERPFLFRWESSGSTPAGSNSPFFKPMIDPVTGADSRNEPIVDLALNNPASAASMVVTFDMPKAGDDWW